MSFTPPDTLPTNADELTELRGQAIDAFNDLYDADKVPSEAEFADLKAISDAVEKIDAALKAIREEADTPDDESKAPAEKDAPGKAAPNKDADRSKEAAAMAASFADDTDTDEADEKPDNNDADEPEGEKADTDEEEPVTASGKNRTKFSTAATGRAPEVPKRERGFRLTTSAKNFETGVVDSLRVAKEFGGLAQGRAARVIGQGGQSRTTLAILDREVPSDLTVHDEADAIRVLDQVTDERNLDGGSLVAAGGWCSPSETLYDFLPTRQATGLLSLPEVGVSRGGVKFPVEPDFAAIYNEIGFFQTEAQAIAGEEKNCYEIPCADFTEVRLDAVGVCITGGILQDKAWPELTKKYVDEALRLHMHKMSARRIQTVVDGSTKVGTITGEGYGAAGAVLAALELQVADMRARHRISRTEAVEGIAPEWLLSILRADLAYRDEVLPQQVTDQNVIDHFRNLGANLQFVTDWQNNIVGSNTPATKWPTEVQVVLYPAGTWWSAVEPVISLGIVHDSTMLKHNRQIQMFTEDGMAVAKRGPESRIVTIPTPVNGAVGPRVGGGAAAGE